jgi:hypothetical protein
VRQDHAVALLGFATPQIVLPVALVAEQSPSASPRPGCADRPQIPAQRRAILCFQA